MSALSYQGISDQVASDYMERHGRATWPDIDVKVAASPTCPSCKATGISMAAGTTRSAGPVPSLTTSTPVPCHPTTCAMVGSTRWPTLYSCSSRDIADRDLVGWIDRQFQTADDPRAPTGSPRLRESLIGPLREVYGVSDKFLTMTLSCILWLPPNACTSGMTSALA